jgi:DNA-binding response OmpR family regulator
MINNNLYHNILLAEDDNDDYDFFLSAIKEYTNVALRRVTNGEQLMRQLNEHIITPDIIFLDINMPRKNGMQCLQEIRKSTNFISIPVIIMSTTRNEDIIETFYHAGANFYICKPNLYNDLKDIIQKTLSIDWKKAKAYSPKENFVYFGKESRSLLSV